MAGIEHGFPHAFPDKPAIAAEDPTWFNTKHPW
jgi:hypothetical protein